MYKTIFKTMLISTALVLVLAACGQKPGTKGAAKGGPTSPVIAVVNGTDITAEDFKAEAANLSPVAQQALSENDNKQKFLDNLISKQLIIQEAEKKGLADDPDFVKKLKIAKDNLLLGIFVKKEVIDKATATDQEVHDYFDKNKQDMGSIRISHILVATEPEAEQVLAKLKGGADFGKLAKQYSLDKKTKDNGGDLGYVQWSQFGSESLKETAFKLKPGEVSGIVQSQFGYHIIKVTDKKPAKDSDFEHMKEGLKAQVSEKRKEDLFTSTVKALKDKAKVTTNQDALKSLSLSPSEVPGLPQTAK